MVDRELVVWDANIVIALIKKEPERILRIKEVLGLVKSGSISIGMPELICKEAKGFDKFMKLLDHKEAIVFPVDSRVKGKRQEIMDALSQSRNKNFEPDATYIATALIYKAVVLHTFDNGMLKLGGKPEVEGLQITECIVPGMQTSIPEMI